MADAMLKHQLLGLPHAAAAFCSLPGAEINQGLGLLLYNSHQEH